MTQAGQVSALLRSAFPTGAEADLVARLRAEGRLVREFTESGPEGLIGYAALSAMEAPGGWLCLAPVAVAPSAQGRGIGKRLSRAARDWAVAQRLFVVVLGDPGFYGACGFSQARASRLTSPYPVSHTLLAGPGDEAPAAALVYPRAFSEIE